MTCFANIVVTLTRIMCILCVYYIVYTIVYHVYTIVA